MYLTTYPETCKEIMRKNLSKKMKRPRMMRGDRKTIYPGNPHCSFRKQKLIKSN